MSRRIIDDGPMATRVAPQPAQHSPGTAGPSRIPIGAPAPLERSERRTFGQTLDEAIAADGRTVAEVALLLGASRANVELWCDDLVDPWPENFDALTEYLGVDMDELGSLVIRSQVRRATGEAGGPGRYPEAQRIAN